MLAPTRQYPNCHVQPLLIGCGFSTKHSPTATLALCTPWPPLELEVELATACFTRSCDDDDVNLGWRAFSPAAPNGPSLGRDADAEFEVDATPASAATVSRHPTAPAIAPKKTITRATPGRWAGILCKVQQLRLRKYSASTPHQSVACSTASRLLSRVCSCPRHVTEALADRAAEDALRVESLWLIDEQCKQYLSTPDCINCIRRVATTVAALCIPATNQLRLV